VSGADSEGSDGTGAVIKRRVVIRNQRGLHARAAGKFAKAAGQFKARITVAKSGQSVSGSSILGLMMLAAATGNEIEIAAEGADAAEAVEALCRIVEAKFEEE
jgi:phosphocarrier protein HPr